MSCQNIRSHTHTHTQHPLAEMMMNKLKITQSQRDNNKKNAKYAHVFATNKQITSAHKRGVATYTQKKNVEHIINGWQNVRKCSERDAVAMLCCAVWCALCQVPGDSGKIRATARGTSVHQSRLHTFMAEKRERLLLRGAFHAIRCKGALHI